MDICQIDGVSFHQKLDCPKLEADDDQWEGEGIKNGQKMDFHADPKTGVITSEAAYASARGRSISGWPMTTVCGSALIRIQARAGQRAAATTYGNGGGARRLLRTAPCFFGRAIDVVAPVQLQRLGTHLVHLLGTELHDLD
ncbi:hypothetical protein [Bradyrhizobium sp. sBnM-33]|uniref:hypothetical protein n=1 Tax=Bradyrhizobium sp. sBnM-33 TaxID=2831780 RepID=UPI0028A18732|nr:hypothetical protein [Bradyrhizobium sp. sBnM-33]WOH47641.1 hypothetical protein RX328_26105 [Bradyrhizobium sp. sBnM-33]